jgi:glycerate 2-kinase
MDLESIYRQTLQRCAPERLVRVPEGAPRNVVAIGKCAASLLRGVGDFDDALVIIPAGYPRFDGAECIEGGHPEMTPASFAAGRRLLEFVDAHDDILFLISGGGSACVEVPLPPHTEEELTRVNHELLRSGLPIHEMNAVRMERSAIKGGRLGRRVRGRCVTLVYSDVSTGRLEDVASGPTLPVVGQAILPVLPVERGGGQAILPVLPVERRGGQAGLPVLHLIADNATLVAAAADIARDAGWRVTVWPDQLECDVAEAANKLAEAATKLQQGQLLVAGGETTVSIRGDGKGGRCTELAVRFARHRIANVAALIASSDGVDGNSGAAGALALRVPSLTDLARIDAELAASNSIAAVDRIGRAIMIPPTGNNLRDLILLART